jgi:hypothetical protein
MSGSKKQGHEVGKMISISKKRKKAAQITKRKEEEKVKK